MKKTEKGGKKPLFLEPYLLSPIGEREEKKKISGEMGWGDIHPIPEGLLLGKKKSGVKEAIEEEQAVIKGMLVGGTRSSLGQCGGLAARKKDDAGKESRRLGLPFAEGSPV